MFDIWSLALKDEKLALYFDDSIKQLILAVYWGKDAPFWSKKIA